ncbi:tRNA1(Val) (adenine(37)-N6)-methyltransferase [Mongoliitalea daihaiensis]|uniref:tRNA1(Val) (adenine(37)-N6)-methyltransferase n=1 Tax=Mongoliitalea daihaiensis TaxID=2782006 RepID=UPI001F21E985|nr:methyltransferase [Mongoliitalea daihaiensis]UJP65604.1 methyltransferase [Mongoliitalea daihaiensis]
MRKGYFQFKQFGVRHEKSAMKVSTDAVVLGALAGSKTKFGKIFEIGLGTGVISLMLAQRYPESLVSGVEIDKDAFEEAQFNADASPFVSRIHFQHMAIQEFLLNAQPASVDLLVSNPPYFSDHLKSVDSKRSLALHTDALSFDELLEAAAFLVDEVGEFWVILPERQMMDLIKRSQTCGFYHFSTVVLRDQPNKPVLRLICGFSKSERNFFQNEIAIKNDSGKFNSDYAHLLREFLLIF